MISPDEHSDEGYPIMPWNEYRDDIQKVVIEKGCISVAPSAFEGMKSLKEAELADSIENIYVSAFAYSGLQRINLPSTLKGIGNGAFAGSELEEITIPAGIDDFGLRVFKECRNLGQVSLEEGITVIQESTFSGCTGLKSVKFPEKSLTEIKKQAFMNSGFVYFTLPDSVRIIGDRAFYISHEAEWGHPEGLEGEGDGEEIGIAEIVVPEGLESLGEEAFGQVPNNQSNEQVFYWHGDVYTPDEFYREARDGGILNEKDAAKLP